MIAPEFIQKVVTSSADTARTSDAHENPMLACYIHIPFCISRCSYCDFHSQPAEIPLVEDYMQALTSELTMFGRHAGRPLDTLYVGGGTPTVLTEEQLSDLFGCIYNALRLSSGAEITIEANPDTITIQKARLLVSLGINRVSLGVQSLNDDLLKFLGRTHTAHTALHALETLRQVGFSNINTDLIWAIPGQESDIWKNDLRKILSFRPEHLSLYCLSIEEGASFHHEVTSGNVHLPSEDLEIDLYRIALEETSHAGYDQYEVSNYARSGFRSRHNCIYWTGHDYYGAGAGAHSFFRNPKPCRTVNILNVNGYVQALKKGTCPVSSSEILTEKTFLAESVMLSLRLTDGFDVKNFRKRYGVNPLYYFEDRLSEPFQRGWLELCGDRLRLTPEGILFSNEVFMRLF